MQNGTSMLKGSLSLKTRSAGETWASLPLLGGLPGHLTNRPPLEMGETLCPFCAWQRQKAKAGIGESKSVSLSAGGLRQVGLVCQKATLLHCKLCMCVARDSRRSGYLSQTGARPYDASRNGYKDWSFLSTHPWDEDPLGVWTLLLENEEDAHNTGFLTHFVLKLYGTDEDMSARRAAAWVVSECVRRDVDGTCQECSSPFYPFYHLCLSYCPPRYYNHSHRSRDPSAPSRTVQACAACHFSCYMCHGGTANNCTACPPFSAYDKLTRSCSQPVRTYLPRGGNIFQGPQGLLLLIAVIVLCGGPVLLGVLCLACRLLHLGGPWQKKPDPALGSEAAILELVRCNPIGSEEQREELGQWLLP